ncbi:MAG TPA: hemolysin III family protein [Rectinemataceae bacterium]
MRRAQGGARPPLGGRIGPGSHGLDRGEVRLKPLSGFREPFNAWSHLAGAAVAFPASIALVLSKGRDPASTAAYSLYGASLVFMLAASGLYHASQGSPRRILLLRKLDHSAIYLLIAGTYSPFCLVAFSGFWKWGLFAAIWVLALAGIALKLFVMGLPRAVTTGIYLAMGWMSLFAGGQFRSALSPASLGWLVAGGLLYTAGALVYATKKLDFLPGRFGFHGLWHIFVLAAAGAHFVSVASLG